MQNVFSHPYQLDKSISNFRIVLVVFFIQILKRKLLFVSSVEPDQTTPHIVAFNRVLRCLPMSPIKDA